MFRAHLTKVSAILLLTLALGVISAPAQAAGFSSERSGRWEQIVGSFFGWLLKSRGMIDPDGGAALSPDDSGMIDPNGKAASTAPAAGEAALCLDYSGCIDPNGRQ